VSTMVSPMVTPDWSDPRIFYNRRILLGGETRNSWDELVPHLRAWYEDTKREEKGVKRRETARCGQAGVHTPNPMTYGQELPSITSTRMS
jgi:hypothetical protein